jgi:hypothetical protein
MRTTILRALTIAITILTGHLAVEAQQPPAARGAGSGDKYVVCTGNGAGTQYVSAAFAGGAQPSGQDRANWNVAFGKFIRQKYGVLSTANCIVYNTRALADDALERLHDLPGKVIETGWTIGAGVAEEPAGMFAICYSDASQSPMYYSADIHLDFASAPQREKATQDARTVALRDQYQKEFLAFLQNKYGYRNTGAYATTCRFDMKYQAEVTALKERIATQAPAVKVTETGWLPGTALPPAAAPAVVPPARGTAKGIAGVYTGSYVCGGRTRSLKLEIAGPENGFVTAHFTAYIPPESHDKPYTFTSRGQFDPATGRFKLTPMKWDTAAPPNIVMVGMTGTYDEKADKVTGKIDYSGCTTFEAMRGREE